MVLVEWMDEVSVQTTPNTLQQKAHLDGGSQSYRHGWRRSSFNSSWFEREARTSHLFGKSTQCQCLAVSHLTSQIHLLCSPRKPPMPIPFIAIYRPNGAATIHRTNLDLYALH